MLAETIHDWLEAAAWTVAILTFPLFCIASLRQSDAFEMELIAKHRTRLDETQRRYRQAAKDGAAAGTSYDEAAIDLLSVLEDLAFFINHSFMLARARRYLTGELRSDLRYLFGDERFREVFTRNLAHEGALVELARFMKRHQRFFAKPKHAPASLLTRL